jgi:hypothetical protein
MNWIIKIENKPNLRINVKFRPQSESIIFIGQYKIPKTNEWVDFNHKFESMDITIEKIQEAMLEVYDGLKKIVDAYENLLEGFKFIKVIEIREEGQEVEIKKEENNDVFGEETPNESLF